MVAKNKSKRMKLAEKPLAPGQIAPTTTNQNSLAPNSRAPNDRPVNTDGTYPQARTPFPAAAGATASGPSGNNNEPLGGQDSESGAFKTGVTTQTLAQGNSGTQIFGGYFSEEYLATLRGRQGAKQWDEMRRSEAQISMLLNAIMNPIKAANWDFDAFDSSDPDSVKQMDLVRACIVDMIDFDTFKHEALTVIPFGFSLFEVVDSVEFNHPKFGTFNGLKALAFRSQKTIENWQLEAKTGRLIGVNQYTYSDLGGNQFIPGEFLLCFTHSKEGDNYEGISALRPMLGAYMRKNLYLKLAAIGIERYAVGTPIGTIPKGKEKSTEVAAFETILKNFTSHEASYIMKAEGWNVDIQKVPFDADKIKEMLIFENTEFANAVVGNFLALGMNGGGGAYALGSNLGEFFTTGIQAYANLICDVVNRVLIPHIVKMNYGDQPGYPKMKVTGISDKAGKELAETIKFLSDARVLEPDMPLKAFLRKQYKLPKPDLSTATAMPAIPAGATANYPKPNDPVVNPTTGKIEPYSPSQLLSECVQTIKLADAKYVKRWDANKAGVKSLMKSNLATIYAGLKDKLKTRYNSLSGTDKIMAAKGVASPGLLAYKADLRDYLSNVANQAIASARLSVPSKKNVKLAGYDSLPPAVRKLIDIQTSLVVETQAADLEKQVFFQFTSTAASDDDIDTILSDVDEKVLPTLDGSTSQGMSIDAAAGDVVAQVTQGAAMAFYFDEDVLDDIESFTFTNEDPVSECCQALAGTTFAANDPDIDTYQPPLHHNCKSRLVPNLKGAGDNPEIDRGGVSLSRKALDAMTLHDLSSWKFTEVRK